MYKFLPGILDIFLVAFHCELPMDFMLKFVKKISGRIYEKKTAVDVILEVPGETSEGILGGLPVNNFQKKSLEEFLQKFLMEYV